jgi:hypothetical protein
MTELIAGATGSAEAPPSPALLRYLQSLPGALPPAGLELRIMRLRRRRRHGRRVALAAAAGLLLALLPHWRAEEPAPVRGFVGEQQAALQAEIRALDRELQLVHADGSLRRGEDGLWLAREAAARRLTDPGAPPVLIVRL